MYWYILSIVLCAVAFAGAHYKDYLEGLDLDLGDLALTTIVSFIPIVNVVFTVIALDHIFNVLTRVKESFTLTVLKGKEKQ